ncbi:sensor domain-containing diguanylate cyclase [Vibrio brasiliensis]|uniref:GGDEF family protein n=1 Tax=Vibrio brasiliensis LMG 20546 TaxID=945543 RepID=E8LRQ2_9VIBR|nr:diguanylate cyclase [Vibrio brasiliensis]EGA66655.1 GGDEF family protein [Vibrio brasiliensis LMG 20546]MCG9649207.1 sensor domain-containing diguanylate cyclase [Vibrio brasiliensis]MCG9752089.1 sensor domain-containing diguanylate cyclase [Vibrio brasiliensis]MCG9782770.1 sensor domain-containing diguanylate cyclase [Vibrio brasiliensis]
MAYHKGRQHYINALFLMTFIFFVGLIESIDQSQKTFLRDSLLARAKEELSIVRSELEAAIVSDIYVANGLSALVASAPDFEFSGWDLIASSIMRKSNHVQLLGLAPDDVVDYVYPLEGNEAVLGLNYRNIPSQWRSVKKAQEIQEIFISGPVNLVQGGRALIARVPIFSDPPYNTKYWGVCSVVISLDSLFSEAGIASFEHRYNLAIRGTDSSGADGEIFYGYQTTFDQAFASESVHFPYGSWQIAASTKNDLLDSGKWYRVHAVRLLGYPMIIMLVLAFIATYRLYTAANDRALHDELTRLPNRRYFMYTFGEHFNAVKKSASSDSFAILNIDLDKFKAINDTYGHAAGDKVLIATAERLKSVLRASDVVARMGGDEFLILLPRIESSDDIDVINIELQKAVCHTPVIYDQHLINLRVSVGYAIYDPAFEDIEEMFKLADSRMYEEKRRQS